MRQVSLQIYSSSSAVPFVFQRPHSGQSESFCSFWCFCWRIASDRQNSLYTKTEMCI
eukprot:jgi/Botrbrau1/3915/Bobra.0183s0136.1